MSERSVDSAEDLVSPVTLTGSQNRLELAGNWTLLLDDPAAAWAVTAPPTCSPSPSRAGCRSVAASTCARSMRGRIVRHVGRGRLRALLAVGRPGTLLERLDHDDERLIAGWVHALSSAIGDPAPRDVVEFGRPAHRHR